MKIAIDAGHGRGNRTKGQVDSGAVGFGKREADIALAYAKTLKHYCEQSGLGVYMVNTGLDENPVAGRDEQAEAAGCDLFVSIHCNAGAVKTNGTETLYRDRRDMVFAAELHEASTDALGLRDRGLKPETVSPHKKLAIFDFDNGAACLIELGFITNAGDLAVLLSDEKRKAWGAAVAAKLRAFKRSR